MVFTTSGFKRHCLGATNFIVGRFSCGRLHAGVEKHFGTMVSRLGGNRHSGPISYTTPYNILIAPIYYREIHPNKNSLISSPPNIAPIKQCAS